MKKTLVALTIAAFAASASAVTVFDDEGSKIDFDGSLRLAIEKNHVKQKNTESKKGHSYLKNDGSRFGVRTKHNIGENGLFALSRLELRFDSNKKTSDGFGDLRAHRAYVGLGHNAFGELTFGRQVTIADDIGEADKSELYGNGPGSLTTAGNSVVRYDYKGIEGLQVGVNYNFATERDKDKEGNFTEVTGPTVNADGEAVAGKAKNGYGVGATYKFNVAEGQKLAVEAGYTRDNFVTGTNKRHYKDGWAVGFGYEVGALSLGLDGGQSYDKNQGVNTRQSRVAVGANYDITDKNNVYTGYDYTHKRVKGEAHATKQHNFYLGTGYKPHKHVFTFVEAGVTRTPAVAGETAKTESKIGAGLRVFW